MKFRKDVLILEKGVEFRKINIKNICVFVFLVIAAAAFVYVFSYSTSPLYPYYYGGDTAQFLTIGKAWYLGKIPYIDMFDHKGPFIFWIDMLGFMIGKGEKYGVAILQVIFMFFSVWAFYKISQLLYKNRIYGCVVVMITLVAMKLNYVDGNTVEEYCIPFISWSIYEIILYYKNVDQELHSPKRAFFYGLTFGICFLTRITNFIPVCMGIFLVILRLIYKKQYGNLLQNIVAGIVGAMVIVLPFLIYFYQKSALYECIYGTLLYNLEYANERKSWLYTAGAMDIRNYFFNYFISGVIFLSACISFVKKDYKMAVLYCATGILEQCLYLHGDNFGQYPLVCIAQIPISFNSVMSLSGEIKPLEKLAMIGSSLIFFTFLTNNISLAAVAIDYRNSFKNKYERGWERLIEQIPENENTDFVAYGGNEFKELYLLEKLMPCYKYFVIQEWHASLSPETKAAIHNTFTTKKAKWILTDSVKDNIQDVLTESYRLVDSTDQFYLYERK